MTLVGLYVRHCVPVISLFAYRNEQYITVSGNCDDINVMCLQRVVLNFSALIGLLDGCMSVMMYEGC